MAVIVPAVEPRRPHIHARPHVGVVHNENVMYFLALMDRANDRSIQFVQCGDEVNAMRVVLERDAIAVGVFDSHSDLCAAALRRWKIVAPKVTVYEPRQK